MIASRAQAAIFWKMVGLLLIGLALLGAYSLVMKEYRLILFGEQFTTQEGKAVEVETLATFDTEAKVGDSHPMIYLPANPENAKIYSAKQLWLAMIVGTVFSIGCLLLGVWRLRRSYSVG